MGIHRRRQPFSLSLSISLSAIPNSHCHSHAIANTHIHVSLFFGFFVVCFVSRLVPAFVVSFE